MDIIGLMKISADRKALLLIAFVGIGYRLAFIWSGWAEGSLIADDAYYYFTIARNIASGFGPTFDRLAPTNGFHPLWLLLLVPIFKAFGTSLWLPVRLALSLSAAIDLLSGLVIYNILHDSGIKPAALIAASVWLLSPFTLLLGLRGMEISLAVLMTMLLLLYLNHAISGSAGLSIKSSIFAGFLLGLAGLARTDNLPILGLTIVALILIMKRQDTFIRRAIWLLETAGATLLVTLPWFLWNYRNFGSVMQVSGQVKFYLIGKWTPFWGTWNSVAGAIRSFSYTVLAPVVFPSKFLSGEEFRSPRISIAVIIVMLAIIFVTAYFVMKGIKRKTLDDSTESVVMFSALYMLLHVIIYGIFLRFYAVWYALPSYAFLAILMGISIPLFFKELGRLKIIGIAVISLLIAFGISIHLLFFLRNSHQPRGPESYYGQTLSVIAGEYPRGAIIGAFNAGALGYIARHYGKLTVTNLDCLVNNVAFDAVKTGRYLDYVIWTVDLFYENPNAAAMFLSKAECDRLIAIYHRKKNYWIKASPNE
jgi:hypothetical protein